ncbi:membrane-associated, eicosanoid/glutathione metabolism protein [Neurospora hispaniola]|uniref:Membrane-associated, eicosanoid/glutathione metabolism protein n=1 Tax=Neurospora hispaniola TaxID=588809 RepID=A0AAJ0IEP3_9PEZI|nr:membrane-associated, eicosanoid/glutathione metabolism protein [Neurospora hispaniola]
MSTLLVNKPLLGPLVGLNVWTFAMEALLYIRRTPALSKYGVTFDPNTVKQQKAEKLPPFVQWPADNFNNLLEQPTQFYAVLLALSLMDVKDKTTVRLAWGYVGLRVLHSLIHVTTNNVLLRFPVFATSSVVLLGMTAKAAWELFF